MYDVNQKNLMKELEKVLQGKRRGVIFRITKQGKVRKIMRNLYNSYDIKMISSTRLGVVSYEEMRDKVSFG